MNRLNRKVDELSQVRQTVNQISTQVNFERQEMSRLRKTVQKTSLEIKKVENSVSSRLSSLEEKFQSTSGGGLKITRTSEEPVEDGDHVTSLKKLEQLSRIYGERIIISHKKLMKLFFYDANGIIFFSFSSSHLS